MYVLDRAAMLKRAEAAAGRRAAAYAAAVRAATACSGTTARGLRGALAALRWTSADLAA